MYQDYLEEERRLHEGTLAMQRLESQMELRASFWSKN